MSQQQTSLEPTNESQPAMPKPRDGRALSAYRHGLTGQIHIFTPADQVAYDKHCQGYHQSLAPQGHVETDLVQSIADDRWRLKRAAALEAAIFAEGITLPDEVVSGHPEIDSALAHGRVWLAKGGNLQLLSLYESRIQRRFERNMAQLRQFQAERKAALQQVVEEASLLSRQAQSEGRAFDIERDFPVETLPPNFVFSTAAVARLALHQGRIAQARKTFAAPSSHRKFAA
jgi:hypothetical protein